MSVNWYAAQATHWENNMAGQTPDLRAVLTSVGSLAATL